MSYETFELLLKQLVRGSDLLAVALLTSILFIVLYRRESIVQVGLFRIGVILFALSIAVPPFLVPLLAELTSSSSRGPGVGLVSLLFSSAAPVLQALTVLCIFNALMPRVFTPRQPETPQKHPLD